MNRLNFIKTMLGAAVAWSTVPGDFALGSVRQLTLDDLVQMRDQGLTISRDNFRSAFLYENKHRNFRECFGCGAKTGEQHDVVNCKHATVLVLPDWYEELKRRDAAD